MNTESKYGYKIGDIVISKVQLSDDRMQVYPAGTTLRIVAIAPKVTKFYPRMMRYYAQKYPGVYDKKDYFFNAVISTQENDYSNRIRADFITIKKIKA